MVMDGNQTFGGDHFEVHKDVKFNVVHLTLT